ncbi:MAG: hypothetical protein MZU79_04075 [Anaerotruncus sp.]|nr:hypothetical protein [Anaerotruncus sp.]
MRKRTLIARGRRRPGRRPPRPIWLVLRPAPGRLRPAPRQDRTSTSSSSPWTRLRADTVGCYGNPGSATPGHRRPGRPAASASSDCISPDAPDAALPHDAS